MCSSYSQNSLLKNKPHFHDAGITTLPTIPRASFLPKEAQVFDAEKIIIHPQYNQSTFDFDMALVSFNMALANKYVLMFAITFKVFQKTDFVKKISFRFFLISLVSLR